MAKDPAFLFYSKDWIEGTMEMTPEEKGVYIDLLSHQHQKGNLPQETKRLCKLVGLSEPEFLPIWAGIKQKFKPTEDNRIHNLRLTGVVTERLERGRQNKIIGILAVAVRQSKKPQELKNLAKKGFRVEDFTPLPDHQLTERITEWFTKRLASLEDGNGNEDANENINNSKESENFLIPKMCQLWYTSFPLYTQDRENDYSGMGKVLKFIYRQAKVDPTKNQDTQEKTLNTLQLIADQVNREQFWVNKPIKSIANNIQEFYNKIKNPIDEQSTSNNSKTNGHNFKTAGQDGFADRLKNKLKNAQQ